MIDLENKKRYYIVFMTFVLMFISLIIKIITYNYFNIKDLPTIAENQYQYREKVQELNYTLLDCEGRNLINYKDVYYAVIDPYTYLLYNHYAKKDELEALKIILKNYDKKYNIDNALRKDKGSKIKWVIDSNTYNKLKEIKGVNGFYVYKYSYIDRKNSYWNIINLITNPNKNENNKLQKKSDTSIEMEIVNKTKNNDYTYNVFDKNVNGCIINESVIVPKKNINVKLTLDKKIQNNIENIINSKKYDKIPQVGVVLMESDTGKIRAMVQKDDSKPNVNIGASTQNGFFAGSIFKIIVEEAGIDANKISLNHMYKHRNFGGLFEEHEDHKDKNVKEAFIKSSNNIFVQIGKDIGIKSIDNLSRQHGLYEKVLDFDLEQKGNLELDVKNTHDDSGDGMQSYIGQKTRITPIEAISISNTVVNNGMYIKPTIIDSYVDTNNNLLENKQNNKRRIVSEVSANILKNQMIDVVKKGTGKRGYIDGKEIGGKTGTSNRIEKRYSNKEKLEIVDLVDGWFCGFFKVGDKYYSMVVFAQNIDKDINASGSAVPIFKKIVEKNYDYLNKF